MNCKHDIFIGNQCNQCGFEIICKEKGYDFGQIKQELNSLKHEFKMLQAGAHREHLKCIGFEEENLRMREALELQNHVYLLQEECVRLVAALNKINEEINDQCDANNRAPKLWEERTEQIYIETIDACPESVKLAEGRE